MRIVSSCAAVLAAVLGLAALTPAPTEAGIFIGIGIGRRHHYYGPAYYGRAYYPAPVYAAPPAWNGYGYGYAAPYYAPAPVYAPAPAYAPIPEYTAYPAPAYYPGYGYPAYPPRKVEIEYKHGGYEAEYKY